VTGALCQPACHRRSLPQYPARRPHLRGTPAPEYPPTHLSGVIPELRKRAPQARQQLPLMRCACCQRGGFLLKPDAVAMQEAVEGQRRSLIEAMQVLQCLWPERPQ
jgi:hypothetical protein